VGTLPQQTSESFNPLIPEVLVFKPGLAEPPTAASGHLLLRIFRDGTGGLECRVEWLESSGERIDQGDVVSSRGIDDGDGHSQSGTSPHHDGAISLSVNILWVVNSRIRSTDIKATVCRGQVQGLGSIVESDTIVQSTILAILVDEEVGDGGSGEEVFHGDFELVAVCGSAFEGLFAESFLAEPDLSHEIWFGFLEDGSSGRGPQARRSFPVCCSTFP